MKKRAWCLYRVSRQIQVDADKDIKMQKTANRNFINQHKDWELTREIYERGISGWKYYSEDRDELLEIKRGAEKKEFDVLVVFMFDRIGRKDDETPFVVEFLVNNGVEVWSVTEGQRKLEHHVDKLINYITFWQSSGESLKTSQRVTEKLSQLNQEGRYSGGTPPFGYELYETNVKNPKKDKFVKDLRVYEDEASLMKLCFNLLIDKTLGCNRIAKEINELGYRTRKGNLWHGGVIHKMLRNPIYAGYKQWHVTKSKEERKIQPKREDLVIISEDTWNKAQKILDINKTTKEHSHPSSSKILLAGLVRCGYCGRKLYANYHLNKYKKKDGLVTKHLRPRYVCSYGISVDASEHEIFYFTGTKYEQQVVKIVKGFMEQVNKETFINQIEKYAEEMVKDKTILLNKLLKQQSENKQSLESLQKEIEKCLLGKSRFKEETLAELISKKEIEIETFNVDIERLDAEINNSKIELCDVNLIAGELENWEEKFDNADIDTKKTMLSRVIDSIYFKKNEVEINLNLNLKQTIARFNEVQNYLSTGQYEDRNAPQILRKLEVLLVSNF